MRRALAHGALALLPCGCLANTYEVAPHELERLATLDPAERGDEVRAVQQTSVRRDRPTTPPPVYAAVDGPPEELYTPPPGVGDDDQRVEGNVEVHGSTTVTVDGAPRTGRPSRHRRPSLGLSGMSGGSGLSGDGAVVVAAVGLAVAGGVMIAMVPTEGARHDGWLRLERQQPLYVVRPRGASEWIALDALTPQDARDARRAVVVADEGVEELDRAPLDREGFDYELHLGGAGLHTVDGARGFGFQGRVGAGYFPRDVVGFVAGGQFATGDDGGRIFNGRLFAEVQVLPLVWRRLHLGAFAEGGPALAKQDRAGATTTWGGAFVGAGGIAQIDVTTRLAMTLRGGYVGLPEYGRDGLVGVPEISAGIALY